MLALHVYKDRIFKTIKDIGLRVITLANGIFAYKRVSKAYN